MTDITQADLDRLAQWDTPTICNGLETLDETCRLSGYTNRQFACLRPDAKPIVGYARTATRRFPGEFPRVTVYVTEIAG